MHWAWNECIVIHFYRVGRNLLVEGMYHTMYGHTYEGILL